MHLRLYCRQSESCGYMICLTGTHDNELPLLASEVRSGAGSQAAGLPAAWLLRGHETERAVNHSLNLRNVSKAFSVLVDEGPDHPWNPSLLLYPFYCSECRLKL